MKRFLTSALVLSAVLFASAAQAGNKPWSYIADATKRFVVLPEFYDLAVLDRATGLIWTKAPRDAEVTFQDAPHQCYVHHIATVNNGRFGITGWRLPTVDELMSLLEVRESSSGGSGGVAFTLPSGHPFDLGDRFLFWSSTPAKTDPSDGLARGYMVDVLFTGASKAATFEQAGVWCVRG